MDATARFAQLLGGPEAALALDEAALLIAAHAYPGLDVAAQLARLDELAAGCGEPTLRGLRRHLFVEVGLAGNQADYYDARNSYLNDVLDRRTGIPITLAVVTIEVGRRIGAPLAGVGMPGHFLVRDRVDPEVFVDPFAGGAVLDRRACEARFRAVQGPGAVFDPAYLQPVGRRDIVARMLANLRVVHTRAGATAELVWVLRLQLALPGADPGERRALAGALSALGRYGEAAAELEGVVAVLSGRGDDQGAERAATAALRLRARLN